MKGDDPSVMIGPTELAATHTNHSTRRVGRSVYRQDHCKLRNSRALRASQNYRINDMRPFSTKTITIVMLLAASTLGGCATKKFVREQIAPVSERVGVLETQLQATDGIAKQALAEAQASTGQVQQHGQRLDQLNGRVDSVEQRFQEQERRGKRPRH